MMCAVTDDQNEQYANEIASYLEECITEGVEYFNDLEGECSTVTRDFYICVSNLDCAQYLETMEGTGSLCADEIKAFNDCQGNDLVYTYSIDETHPTDQYEPDNTQDDASEIMPGESQERTLEDPDDVDFVTFSAVEGKVYTIETSINEVDNTDTELTLRASDLSMIDENDDKNDDSYESLIEWTATSTGTYLIEVTTLAPGPYVLRVTEN